MISELYTEQYGQLRTTLLVNPWSNDRTNMLPHASVTDGACGACGSGDVVLEMDNSGAEYIPYFICRACIQRLFDAFLLALAEREAALAHAHEAVSNEEVNA